MKILFMGTPDLAANILKQLLEAGHDIIGVVTQPDKEKGRGKMLSFPPVKELALENNLEVFQPIKVRETEFIESVRSMAPECIVVAAFGQILPKALLDIPPYGCINVHTSLLPKYRGAAPIQYSIIHGESKTGVTIMYMDVGIDTGDMILQEAIDIAADETGGSLHDKLSDLGAKLLLKALTQLENGTAARIPQKDSEATHVSMIDKDMGKIDFGNSAVQIERLIRGLNPWPSAYTYLDNKTLKLWQADVIEGIDGINKYEIEGEPGVIVEVSKTSFTVRTGEGYLVIKELQLEGKKRLSCDAFLRGYPLKVGTKLGTIV